MVTGLYFLYRNKQIILHSYMLIINYKVYTICLGIVTLRHP